MKQIDKVIGSVSQNRQQETESRHSPQLTRKLIVALWEKMTHLFGHRWTGTFGNAATNSEGELTAVGSTWASGLHGLTPDNLATGLQALCESNYEWPPSLPEFAALCRKQAVGLTHNTAAYKIFKSNRLIEKKPNKDKAKSEMQKIKDML